jgi:hypothetical protein
VLALQTNNGTTAVTIDTSQNVGIGTTSPASKLHVYTATGQNINYIETAGSGNDAGIYFKNTARIWSTFVNGGDGAYRIYDTTAGTERMRIDSSGNVGVGTSSPSTYGKFVAYSSGGYAAIDSNGFLNSYQLLDTASAGGKFTGGSNQGVLGSISIEQATTGSKGGYIAFRPCASGSNSPTEAMRIASDGAAKFSMGNFANGASSTNAGFVIENNGNSPFINHSQTATSLQTYYAFTNGNGVVGTIKCTGSTTQFNTSSDVRLKKNVVDAPSAIASIQQIGIKSFDWKADDLHQEYGVIAQELDAIAPEAVSHGGTEDEMWGVDYSKLVPRMIKAMQEQAETINALTARIVALEK